MDRLTRPDVEALQTSARFMGTEVKIQDIGDKLLHLILNGPTINSINKDTLRHLVRQLYTELKRYEDLEMTPEAIEQQLKNFSSFLMEMTGGRMSKTNYTVQAMVSEANNYNESLCDECADRQELAEVKKEQGKFAKDTNVRSKKSLLFSKRMLLAQLSENWNMENGVRECAFSTITYLHANGLIDEEKVLAFIESAEKKKED